MAHAAPLVGARRVDVQVWRSGVGDEVMTTICAEAHGVRVVDVVGGVVAHRDPPPIRAHAHAIRDVEVPLQQDLAASERPGRVAIEQMPGDGVAAVVADQDLTRIVVDAGDRHRARRIQEGGPVRGPPGHREHLMGRHVPLPRRHPEQSDVTLAARDEQGVVVDEVHPMGPLQRR